MADAIAHPHHHADEVSAKLVLSGTVAESIVGIGTMVLAILGLTGFLPSVMLSIATMGLGVSFLFEGGSIATRLSNLMHDATEGRLDIAELGGGMSAEFVAGLGGLALGILALVGLLPQTLTAIAAIAFGATLILSAGVKNSLKHFHIGHEENETAQNIAHQVIMTSNGVQILTGLGGIVLGILALVGIEPMLLTLVAMLAISGAVLLGGTALGAKMLTAFRY